jgi:hypothetical protein
VIDLQENYELELMIMSHIFLYICDIGETKMIYSREDKWRL